MNRLFSIFEFIFGINFSKEENVEVFSNKGVSEVISDLNYTNIDFISIILKV